MSNPSQSDEQRANQLGQAAAAAASARPLVLPEKFNGTGNFNEWISHFEGIAVLNKWKEEEKSLWLRIRLTDKAHVALNRLPNDAHQSYSALKSALTERFEPSSKQEVYKAEFECRHKRKRELGRFWRRSITTC